VNPDLRILISLQDLDQQIGSLQKQVSDVPVKVAALQEELARLREARETRVARSQEVAKRRRTIEGEVELQRTKLARLRDQLMAVKTNKEYTAMLHEIQTVEGQIRAEEDKVLDCMEEAEQLEGELKRAEQSEKARAAEIEAAIRTLEAGVPALAAEVTKLDGEKRLHEERVGAELLGRYRQLSEYRRGLALAEARDELCSACHVRIRPQVYADLRRSEDIFYCDSCNRILFVREVVA
jgi:predicted  nucleic acid-binding Zn-ribbon protein